jgi:hypothetical protein
VMSSDEASSSRSSTRSASMAALAMPA